MQQKSVGSLLPAILSGGLLIRLNDLRDHNPNRPPASSQLPEPDGRRPAVPLNRW
jgi:hypothetical protein